MTAVLIAAGLAVFLFIALRQLERVSLYFPDKQVMAEPSGIGIKFENVIFKTEDGVNLHGWFIPHAKPLAVVLYMHGNAGNIAYRFDTIEWFREMGVELFLFDWRGYGRSEGIPSEKGLYADARAAWKYLTQERRIPSSRIFIFGESLGAAPAVELALELESAGNPPAGLATEGAFASTRHMAKTVFPYLPSVFLPLRDLYDNLSKIGKLKLPKLLAHGQDDDIVPFSQGKMLFDSAQEPKIFLPLPGTHNDARFKSGKLYTDALKNFFKAGVEDF